MSRAGGKGSARPGGANRTLTLDEETSTQVSSSEKPVAARVLVVDDFPELRKLVSRTLTKVGYEVVEAETGREAIELARASSFDVVLSDVAMPDMNGVDVLRELHGSNPDLPVLLISGAPDLTTAMEAVEYGAFGYLMKPVEPSKLRDSIARAVDSGRKRQEAKDALDRYQRENAESGSITKESWTGDVLAEEYRIGALIGQGGMGDVYEARHDRFGLVAVKIVHKPLRIDAQVLARFRREAQTLAAIEHPNIVRVFDFRAPEDGPALLVMERLRGTSLGRVITSEGKLAVPRVVAIGTQVLSALAAAHERRIIHRDLKPENIFLTQHEGTEVVRLLDFGIAKVLDDAEDPKLTRTGAVLGTPAYMAPEQARGAGIDLRSDIYAAGCVLYEALAGRPPFVAENYNALLVAIQEDQAKPLTEFRSDVDEGLAEVIAKAMAKRADDRFDDAEQMLEALQPWNAPESVVVPGAAFVAPPTLVSNESSGERSSGRSRSSRS